MKRIICLSIVLAILGATGITAQDAKKKDNKSPQTNGTEYKGNGVMVEFRRLEEEIKNRKTSPSVRKKLLETNLIRAMKEAIFRRFYDVQNRDELLKEITPKSIKYENPTSPLVYFVKFKNYYAKFDYRKDPRDYFQSPYIVKFIIKKSEGEHDKTKNSTK